MTRIQWTRLARGVAVVFSTIVLSGCISMAEFRKLEYEVNKLKIGSQGAPATDGVADLRAEVETLRDVVAALEGRLEVAEHATEKAREEAAAARLEANRAGTAPEAGESEELEEPAEVTETAPGASSEELSAYRVAYDAWRTDDNDNCIDHFSAFLQSFPASLYADDASYWLADCHYKNGDYKNAILRFDDVASRHPDSDKAPEALYRQGEALLQLGPGFNKAAQGAFQKIVTDYPDSRRARPAADQLELLGASE
jgi:tol-pal system protein YbgF